MRIKRV